MGLFDAKSLFPYGVSGGQIWPVSEVEFGPFLDNIIWRLQFGKVPRKWLPLSGRPN